MNRHSIIVKALTKTQGQPPEVQAAAIEMLLDFFDDGPEPTPVLQPPSNQTSVATGSPLILDPNAKIVAAPLVQRPPEPVYRPDVPMEECRNFSDLVQYLAGAIPKALDVVMADGKTTRVLLKQEPRGALKLVQVIPIVEGVEGVPVTFDVYEPSLNIEEKLGSLQRGARAMFRPVDEVRPIGNSFREQDFSRMQQGIVVGRDEGLSLPTGAVPAPKSAFRDLIGMKIPGE